MWRKNESLEGNRKMNYNKIVSISKNEKSRVWLVQAEGFDSPLVLKEKMYGEKEVYQCIAKIKNEHIPQIYEIEEKGGILSVLEEYVDGTEIDKYVREKDFTEREIVNLTIQICEGIQVLHEQDPQLIHRDLKPENLLVSGDGIVRIIDFDASRTYKRNAKQDTKLLGTEGYAAPEQYGYLQSDMRSDIYSIGTILYELLLHEPYPKGEEQKNWKKNAYIHRELIRIIDKCTKFAPQDRYKTVQQLKKDLQTYTMLGKKRVAYAVCGGLLVCGLLIGCVNLYNNIIKPMSNNVQDTIYTGEVKEYSFTSYNEETSQEEKAVFYYLKNEPERTPFAVYMHQIGDRSIKEIRVQKNNSTRVDIVDQRFYTQDEFYFVHISNEYLDKLVTNSQYTITVDYGDVTLSIDFLSVEDRSLLSSDVSVQFVPGYYEYLFDEPGDICIQLINVFDRPVKKLVNEKTKEVVPADTFCYDEEKKTIMFRDGLFQNIADGTYLNYTLFYGAKDGLSAGETSLCLCVRDTAYVEPVIAENDFVISWEDLEDIKIEITWNSAKGKVEGIFPREENIPQMPEESYEVVEDGILIKKEFWEGKTAGVYSYYIEFGDVAAGISFTLT